MRRRSVLLGLGASACATTPTPPAAKPLFRDPTHDGAADPSLVRDHRGDWLMFYTNRRADLQLAEANDVSWVHGTQIGIARSTDNGRTWRYEGTARLPVTEPTLWAPNVEVVDGAYHMFLTVVPGVYANWNASRRILHLQSTDLVDWRLIGEVDLGSDRVIDATLLPLNGVGWRLWYKDERDDSRIRFADSDNLTTWRPGGRALGDAPAGEGPKAFRWRGAYWLIVDHWRGLGIYKSDDASQWQAQPARLLAEPGLAPTDRAKGQHADVVITGADRAFLFYFTHQENEPQTQTDPRWSRRSVIQVTELQEHNGIISVDRNAPTHISL